jgi:UDP-N-acetylmuramoylalanine--D-glutamate ligase
VTFGPGGDVDVRTDAVASGATAYARGAITLQGGHNALNVAAALAAIQPFDVPPEIVRGVLASFIGLAHRMVFVRERRGVRFYDDSKGTNVGAAVTAVRGVAERKVVLIAGGRDKGGSYGPLVDALRERGRAAGLAEPGDAVLLSPACSSFDMFRDYKDRGDAFVRAVMDLPA